MSGQEPQKKIGEVGYTFRKLFDDGWYEGKGAVVFSLTDSYGVGPRGSPGLLLLRSFIHIMHIHSSRLLVCHLSSWTVVQIREGARENSQSRLMFHLMPSCLLPNH
eukprot:scaffold73_cov195-Alexandrium_tamarense.AAC.9